MNLRTALASTLQHLLEEELLNPPTAIAITLHLLEEELLNPRTAIASTLHLLEEELLNPRTAIASTLQHLLEEELWNPPTATASTLQHLLEEELHGALVDWGTVVGSHLIDGDVLDALALPQLCHVGDVVCAGLR